MPEASTSELAEEVDTAIRDTYHALRTALHKLEDLKMKIIRHPQATPFEPEHDEMYKMYLDLSARFQTTREEIRERSGLVQPQSLTLVPRVEEQPIPKSPVKRNLHKNLQPYVLVPPRHTVFKPRPSSDRDVSRSKPVAVAERRGPPRGKRKVTEIKKGGASDPDSETENRLSTKKTKISHRKRLEVPVVEEPDRCSSPLTELSSPSPEPPSPPVPSTSINNALDKPTQPSAPARQSQLTSLPLRDGESEPGIPHTVLEPPPILDNNPDLSSKDPPESSGEEESSIGTNKKPKSKGKGKEKDAPGFTLGDSLLDKRLSAVGPDFEVDNDRITHQHVGLNTRATMSYIFGGNPQRMISYPSPKKIKKHGFKRALFFPSRNFNPLLPTKIGERGLLFRLDQGLKQWIDSEGGSGPYHLMMHHTPRDYCYFGVYQLVRVDPVTRDEWLAQKTQVRVNWLSYALTNGIGEQTRARVFLRQRLGREPAKAEVDDYGKDGSAQAEVTPAQMLEAFRSGAEQLAIWGMKCVGYDYEFEKYLADNLVEANTRLPPKRSDKNGNSS